MILAPLLAACLFLAPQRTSAVVPEAPVRTTYTVNGEIAVLPDAARAQLHTTHDPQAREELLALREPVAGLHLAVGVQVRSEVIAERRVHTDADGRYSVELPIVPSSVHARPRTYVRVVEPGYQQRTSVYSMGVTRGTIDMPAPQLIRGRTAYVRVRSQEESSQRIDLHCYENDPPRWEEQSRRGWSEPELRPDIERTIDRGLFALHYTEAARAGLLARQPGVGSAYLQDVRLTACDAGRTLVMELTGHGTLAGQLTNLDGQPLSGVALFAYPASVVEAKRPYGAMIRKQPTLESRGGLVTGSATTDGDGLFEIRGLATGEYFLQASPDASPRLDIDRKLYRAGDRSIRIAVGSHRLVVEVRHADGSLAEAPPFVACLSGPARDDVSKHGNKLGFSAGPGRWSYEVAAGERYAVGWIDETHRLVETTVSIERGRYVTELSLTTGQQTASSLVNFRLLDESGDPFRREPATRSTWTLHSLETDRVLWAWDGGEVLVRRGLLASWRDDDLPKGRWSLPPGRYRLRAGPRPAPRTCGNSPPTRLKHGSAERIVELLPGQQSDIELTPWLGGRVRLTTILPAGALESLAKGGDRHDDLEMPGVRVHEGDESGRRRRLSFLMPGLVPPFSSTSLLPGTTSESESLLRPGRRRLHIEAPGFRSVDVDVTVVAGETVDVVVELQNR